MASEKRYLDTKEYSDYPLKLQKKVFDDFDTVEIKTGDDKVYIMSYWMIKMFEFLVVLLQKYGKIELNVDSTMFNNTLKLAYSIRPNDFVGYNENLEYFGFRHRLLIPREIHDIFDTLYQFFEYIKDDGLTSYSLENQELIDINIYVEPFRSEMRNINAKTKIKNSIVRDIRKLLNVVTSKYLEQFYGYLKTKYKSFKIICVNECNTTVDIDPNVDKKQIEYFLEKGVDVKQCDAVATEWMTSNVKFFKNLDKYKDYNQNKCRCSSTTYDPFDLLDLTYEEYTILDNRRYRFTIPLFEISREYIKCNECELSHFRRHVDNIEDFHDVKLILQDIKN